MRKITIWICIVLALMLAGCDGGSVAVVSPSPSPSSQMEDLFHREASPSPTLEATPEPTLEPTPTATPKATSTPKEAANTPAPTPKATATPKPKATATPAPKNQTGTVYWVANGERYHKTQNCTSLKRSSDIRSGSIGGAGSRTPCKICYK